MPEVELNPYARFLTEPIAASRSVEEILTATPATIEASLNTIGKDQITLPRAPGKWSPADIVAHLADCEIAFAFRLRQTLAEDHHTMQPFDQDRWATNYAGIPASQSLATFTTLRLWNLVLIQAALPASAAKPVYHPERGQMTFQTIVETMAGHDLNHLSQLAAITASTK